MKQNVLQLNSSKTKALLVGSPHQVQHAPITHLTIAGQNVLLSPSGSSLGAKLHSSPTFDSRIKQKCKTSFYHLKNIDQTQSHPLTQSDAEKLVHAFISSRLDYNSVHWDPWQESPGLLQHSVHRDPWQESPGLLQHSVHRDPWQESPGSLAGVSRTTTTQYSPGFLAGVSRTTTTQCSPGSQAGVSWFPISTPPHHLYPVSPSQHLHITSILASLYWLPVSFQIEFKTLFLTHH
jgi:hypothetical protein